jgi:nitroreductase
MDIATVDHLLTSTRSVRKRLDLTRSVEPEILERCIEIALQAPTALYGQTWYFVVITDPARRANIAEIYSRVTKQYRSGASVPDRYLSQLHFIKDSSDPRFESQQRMYESSAHLITHLHEVPILVIPCIQGRMENEGLAAQASMYGSILPATWSLMLALRARDWFRLDHSPSRLRARSQQAVGNSGQREPGRTTSGRVLQRRRLQTRQALARSRSDLLERMGTMPSSKLNL